MTLPFAFRALIPAAGLTLVAACLSSTALAETVDTMNKTFQVAAGGTLRVDVDAGSIDVRTGTGTTVVVDVVRKFRASSEDKEKDMLASHRVKIEQTGNDVAISARGDKPSSSLWNWFGRGSRRDIRYTITVPQSYHADLKTAGGPIEVRGLHGRLETQTSGGPLTFADIQGPINGGTSGGPITLTGCTGDVELHTSGGPIDVENCAGTFNVGSSGGGINIRSHRGQVTAHTSGGGVHVERIAGKLDASTSGGSVSASFTSQPTGDCRLHTSGGGVSLEIPSSARFELDAHTSGGGVSCSLSGGKNVEKSRGSYRASYNGGGPRIELSSSGGGIDIDAATAVEG